MNIYLDVDGCVFKSKKRLCEYLNFIHDKDVYWEDIKDYNCTDMFPETNIEQLEQIFDDYDFYNLCELYDGVEKFIKKVAKKHRIIFLTKGGENNLYHKSRRLKALFPDIPIIGMDNKLGKYLIDLRDCIIIDDHQDNLTCYEAHNILFAPEGVVEYNKRKYNVVATVDSFKKMRKLIKDIEVMYE